MIHEKGGICLMQAQLEEDMVSATAGSSKLCSTTDLLICPRTAMTSKESWNMESESSVSSP